MAKFIGVKMIEAVPMTAREANDKDYKIDNHSFEEDGYEVTYPDGYKSWSPAKEFEKAYYKLEDPAGDVLKENDIKRFIKGIENVKVGTKTTNTTLTCLTGFEVHGQAACVKPENFDLNVGSNYARIKAEDKIWEGLGFVLQWAKYGINVKPKESKYPPHIQRVITEYEELNDKINKLNAFINGNPIFRKLDAEERNDMACQLTSMRNYSDILLSRLTRAGVDFK